MSDLVRMTKPGFPVRHVPREVVHGMVQNGWSTALLDTSTSEDEQVEPQAGQVRQAEPETPPRRRRKTPSGDEHEGEGS